MNEKKKVELHAVVDTKTIEVYGDPGTESKGKEIYDKIKDLLPRWNREIREVFEDEKFVFVLIIH
jgi:hypothetical protein